jgi:hypothetical protein
LYVNNKKICNSIKCDNLEKYNLKTHSSTLIAHS